MDIDSVGVQVSLVRRPDSHTEISGRLLSTRRNGVKASEALGPSCLQCLFRRPSGFGQRQGEVLTLREVSEQ